MWQRHRNSPSPARHVIHASCMQLLPIVEMFCKYELQDDCSDLRALMLRFDSEVQLQSHELGRSLLSMIASEGADLECLPRSLPIPPRPNPFQGVRERLDLAALAILDLNAQVTHAVSSACMFPLAALYELQLGIPFMFFHCSRHSMLLNPFSVPCELTQHAHIHQSASRCHSTFMLSLSFPMLWLLLANPAMSSTYIACPIPNRDHKK